MARICHPGPEADHLSLVFARIAHGIDTADGSDDDHILPFPQRRRGGMPQAVDLIVDGRILFNISIGRCDIRFRLVIIVIRNKVFHPAVREERAQFTAELGGQRLVVGDHQRRHLDLLDHGSHGKCLPAACHAEQNLVFQAGLNARGEGFDRLRLVAGCAVRCFQHKLIHAFSSPAG